MNKNFLRSMLAVAFAWMVTAVQAGIINVAGDITTNTNWTNDNIYILFGDIFVKNGATLTIQQGTIIKGDKTTLSRLVIATGAKIVANGTAEQPIVFTSNLPAGQRARADWAGIAICGLAPINAKDAGGNSIQKRLECGNTTDYDYGGNNPDDSSGVLRFVRIEYAGYVCGSNTELNSLTMGGVGRKTIIENVMVSYGQDDGFEYFGGTVNSRNLVSFALRDDDFDTDDGWSGRVQNGLVIRIDTIADQGDISNAFESDNDPNGTTNAPVTSGVFSNITVIGPAQTVSSTIDSKYGWALRIRRNSSLSVFNSLFIGYKRGLRFEGSATQANVTNGAAEFKNNIIAGSQEQYYETAFDSLYLLANSSNTIIRGNANDTVRLVSPYGNPANYSFVPQAGSPALTGADFSSPKLAGGYFAPTTHRGAFAGDESLDWTNCWTEFTPQDEDYTVTPINYSYNASLQASGSTTFCAGNSVQLSVNTNLSNATYRWSTGASTASINVTASGTYTVTVASARGCKKFFTQVVTVNTPATPVVTPSATSFCAGSTGVTLNSTAANSYAWSNGSSTQQISTAIAGNYTVTTTDANGCTAASAPIQITQNNAVVPAITASGSTSFCTGDNIDISVSNPSQFASFLWSNNATTNTINVDATGSYSVTTTDNNGCTAISNTITTNVSNAPSPTIAANGAIAFCQNDSVVITSTAGEAYLWSTGATTQSIVVKTSGTYTVTVTNDANPCLGAGTSNSITVNVTTNPTASFTQTTGNNSYSIVFNNTSTNATSYLWDFGNGQTSTQQNPTHVYNQDGTYTVTLTANSGNCTDVTTATVSVIGVGVEEITNAIEAIRLYPNPNNGTATLEITTTMNADAVISIVDLSGREVMVQNTELFVGNNHIRLSTTEFANGIYFVSVKNGNNNKMVRMVVNH